VCRNGLLRGSELLARHLLQPLQESLETSAAMLITLVGPTVRPLVHRRFHADMDETTKTAKGSERFNKLG
jgi:hypothetical protein